MSSNKYIHFSPVCEDNHSFQQWQLLPYTPNDGQESEIYQYDLVLSVIGDVTNIFVTQAGVEGVTYGTYAHDAIPVDNQSCESWLQFLAHFRA